MAEHWDLLISDVHAARMLAGEGDYAILEDAALAVRDGRIAWLGRRADLPAGKAEQAISGDGMWLTPGLIDCHTHIVYGGNRAAEFELRLKGASYEELQKAGGGILSTVRATRAASPDELFNSAAKRIGHLKAEGVTTLEIKSGYGLDKESELKMLEVARRIGRQDAALDVCTSFLGAHALPPEFSDSDAYITFVCDEILPAVAERNLADAVDGFCEGIGFSPAQIERLFALASSLGLPVKLHADQLSDLGGAGLAADHAALSADHLEYSSLASIAKMAASGSVAVLLPGAYYVLRETQQPPLDALRKHGVPIAIATDANPGSSPVLSLLLMLNMACILFSLTPAEALAGVTRNAAKALGLEADRGTLEVGKRADLVLWDIDSPAELAYMIGANPCRQVFKDGDRVYSA